MAGKFEEARNYYKNYIDKSESEEDKSKAHYNLGNSFLTEYAKETKETGKSNGEYLQKAINEYKQSLNTILKTKMQDTTCLMPQN